MVHKDPLFKATLVEQVLDVAREIQDFGSSLKVSAADFASRGQNELRVVVEPGCKVTYRATLVVALEFASNYHLNSERKNEPEHDR